MESQINPNPISFARDTIVAVSTPPGTGGIAVIRVSGPEAVDIVGSVWRGVPMKNCESHTAHLGKIVDENGEVLDEVVATLFLAPNSYTGEDIIELSCHGSRWIQREIVNLLIRSGARSAGPGEFSQRAFINGRIDLAQAEGIVDLIASNSRAAQRLAMMQANGHFSRRLEELRNQLIDFASLLELELDFSEEDVEFADRLRLMELADRIIHEVDRLSASYSAGKAFKEGIPVVIAGQPNAGKSTLLNLLLEEEKAIVSDVPGTTRDIIEDTREIDGVLFRFIDTAGLRDTDDTVERIGIERATDRLLRSAIILWIVDSSADIPSQLEYIKEKQEEIRVRQGLSSELEDSKEDPATTEISKESIIQHIVFNKIDTCTEEIDNSKFKTEACSEDIDNSKFKIQNSKFKIEACSEEIDNSKFKIQNSKFKIEAYSEEIDNSKFKIQNSKFKIEAYSEEIDNSKFKIQNSKFIKLSASQSLGLDELLNILSADARSMQTSEGDIMVTNARHYESLIKGGAALRRARQLLSDNLSADFIAQDVREALHHLGEITGTITTSTLLHSIFSRFCIGK